MPEGTTIDPDLPTLENDFRAILISAGIDHNFKHIKKNGNTRPTSRTNYKITIADDGSLVMKLQEPSLQKRMIELHNGHGPTMFKNFQRSMAVGLSLVVLFGLTLGLSAPHLRKQSILIAAFGLVVFLLLFLFA